MTVHHNGNNTETAEELPFNQNGTEDKPEDETEAETSPGQKCLNVFKNITVEPTVMLFIIPYIISTLTMANLSIEKACRVNLNFSDEICTAIREQTLDSQNPFEREVQVLVTTAMTWKTYITATIPCLLGLFVGPWQDKTGHRKIFLILNLAGMMLGSVNCMINVYFFKELNLQVLVFTDAVIEALSGGMCVFVVTIFAYISAITSEKSRTFRLGMVNFSLTVGFPIGTAASGFVLRHLGFYGAYGLVLGLYGVNMLYNSFVLRDPKRDAEQKKVST